MPTPLAPKPSPVRLRKSLNVLLLLVLLLAAVSYFGYRDLENSAEYLVQLEHAHGQIIFLDEVLTTSAQLAAQTGDAYWITRYNRHEPKLQQVLDNTMALAPNSGVADAIAATAQANTALVKLERRAFSLLMEKRVPEANELLKSAGYEQLKQHYAQGMATVVESIHTDVTAATEARRQRFYWVLALITAFAALFLLQALIATRQIRRWQRLLTRNNWQLAQAEAASTQLNQQLEQRVQARTQALQASERQLVSVLNSAPMMLIALDATGRCTLAKGAGLGGLGLQPEDIVGNSAFETYADNAEILGYLHRAFAGESLRVDIHLHSLVLDTRYTPIKNAEGQLTAVICVAHDVTEQHAGQSQLNTLSQVVAQHPAGIAIFGLDGIVSYANPSFGSIFERDNKSIIGRDWSDVRTHNPSKRQSNRLRELVAAGDDWQGDYRHTRRDGSSLWLHCTLAPLRNASGEIHQYLFMAEDISETRKISQQLNRKTYFDALTRLPNRQLALQRLTTQLDSPDAAPALILIDIDNFRRVNDGISHHIGDRLLREVSKRLSTYMPSFGSVARIGSDEFLVLCSADNCCSGVEACVQQLLSEIARPYDIDNRTLHITASAGIAVAPRDGNDTHTLLRNADSALYEAKASGRDTWRFFNPNTNQQAEKTLELEQELRGAIQNGELELYYQPIIDLNTGRANRVEALLRWHSAKFGTVPPDHFIPIAEQSDLISRIGDWVLRQACQQAKAWRNSALGPITIGVNLSPRQFLQDGFSESVLDIINTTGTAPEDIELEITERLLVTDQSEVTRKLTRLDQHGIKLCIDDFGTGYSSLAYLKHYPIDTLKIDRIFVRDVTNDASDAELAAGIISLAHNLSMRATGEGVETAEQLAFLQRNGCDQAQGYYFSKPLPVGEFEIWLRQFPGVDFTAPS